MGVSGFAAIHFHFFLQKQWENGKMPIKAQQIASPTWATGIGDFSFATPNPWQSKTPAGLKPKSSWPALG